MKETFANRQLRRLHEGKHYDLLRAIIFCAYKARRRDVKTVRFLSDLDIWEFHIANQYYFSPGPGWAYDYDYLLESFRSGLGWAYMPVPGDIVVDVGAGIGEELVVFSRAVGDTGKLIAIEAHPKTFEVLKYNAQKNEISNAQLINKAISDSPGAVYIGNEINSLCNTVTNVPDGDVIEIESITIDHLVDLYGLDRIDFMKVNIEGAEQLLLKGMRTTLNKVRNMAISCHDFRFENEGVEFFKTKAFVLEFLRDHGFTCITRETGSTVVNDYVYASRRFEAT